VARIDDIDVSESFEWKVEPLEGAEVTEDMVVLVKRLQAPDSESATEFELGLTPASVYESRVIKACTIIHEIQNH
jgi:hypothetical protein